MLHDIVRDSIRNVSECSTTFDSDGPRAIVDCFDAYYSFIRYPLYCRIIDNY